MSLKRFLTIIIILFAGFSGLFGYLNYRENIYSKETLKLEILAPTEIEAAEEIEYVVKYKNNGNVRLEKPRLIFEYPKHSLISDGELLRKEQPLDDIYPGEEKIILFKTRLLGAKNETRTARASIAYQPKNLEARYETATSHTSLITAVPITFEFDLPTRANTGKEINLQLNYFSNIDYPVSGLRVKIDYPSDFEFLRSNPLALEKNEWDIGLLNRADGGRITVSGIQNGQPGEQKIFRAQLGAWQNNEFILLKETVRGIQMVKPALYISQRINNSEDYTAKPGDSLHYEIFFKNIGENVLNDIFLVVKLEGKIFDFATLKAPLAGFQPPDNSMVWDGRKLSKLQLLEPREEGQVEFWIELKNDWEIAGPEDKNPVLKSKIYLEQAEEEFTTKVNSKLTVEQKAYFEDDVFGNSGPVPPSAGQTTTYTVIWQAKNYFNNVKNAKVKAILPAEVKLTGKIFPEDSRLTFDPASREAIWTIGGLEIGQGVLNAAPNMAFQLSLSPNADNEQGFILIGAAEISGEDQFTETIVQASAPFINTIDIGSGATPATP